MTSPDPELLAAARRSRKLTTVEAGRLAGYTNDHIGLLIRKGHITAEKAGRDWFVEAASLLAYVEKKPRRGRKKI